MALNRRGSWRSPKDKKLRWLKYCCSIYLVIELLKVCCLHSWSSQGPAHEVMALCEVSSELVHSSRTSLADSKSPSPAGWGQLGEITVLCVPGDSRPCLHGAWLLSKHSGKHFSCPTELAIPIDQKQRGSLKENRSCSCSASHTHQALDPSAVTCEMCSGTSPGLLLLSVP